MPVFEDRISQLAISCRESITPASDHDIYSIQNLSVAPETFSNQAFKAIAVDRPVGAFPGDGQTQTGRKPAVCTREHGKKTVGETDGLGEDGAVFRRSGQARLSEKARVLCLASGWVQGVNRARPFARRAWRTLRPLRVAMRARKPWVRARLMRLG